MVKLGFNIWVRVRVQKFRVSVQVQKNVIPCQVTITLILLIGSYQNHVTSQCGQTYMYQLQLDCQFISCRAGCYKFLPVGSIFFNTIFEISTKNFLIVLYQIFFRVECFTFVQDLVLKLVGKQCHDSTRKNSFLKLKTYITFI